MCSKSIIETDIKARIWGIKGTYSSTVKEKRVEQAEIEPKGQTRNLESEYGADLPREIGHKLLCPPRPVG